MGYDVVFIWRHILDLPSFVIKHGSSHWGFWLEFCEPIRDWMIREFPKRGWTRRTVERLIKQIDETGQSCSKQHERQRTVRTPANISLVLYLICSQDEAPGKTKSPREIQRETGISRSSIQRIAKKDWNLKVSRRRKVQQLSDMDVVKRFNACKRFKQRMTADKIEQTWFSDEKIFTVQTPTNTQNEN